MQDHELICSEGERGVGPALVIAEFDFVKAWGKRPHDRSNLPATQAAGRLSLKQRDHREKLDIFPGTYLTALSR